MSNYLQILFNIFHSTSIYFLVAISFNIVYHPTKYFHLVNEVIITIGAYAVFLFSSELSISFYFSVILALIASIIIGVTIELIVYRPMRRKKLPILSFLIVSLGLYIILQNCISLIFSDTPKTINISDVSIGHNIFGAYITTIQLSTIIISLVVFLFVLLFFKFTTIGKSIRAVSSNPELCNTYGISSNKVILVAFAIGSALASIAGILSALDTNMTPMFGFNLLLYGLVAMIIGGTGSTTGLIAGALLIATAQHLAAFSLDTKWIDAITYIILIFFLIWKPLGFSGKRLKKVEV